MDLRVAVIGAGSWGTTVAHLAAHNAETILWARDPVIAQQINGESCNGRYLADYELHPNLRATSDLAACLEGADVVVVGVPSHGYRATLTAAAPSIRPWVPIISLTKGLEQGTFLRMSQVAAQILPGHPVGVLTGPNLAKEIMAGAAAASVISTPDPVVATELQAVFTSLLFRVYTNHDLVGCEVAGALKNVIALASGMADGLGTGDNTRSAVITRGLAELSRLGVAMGGEAQTFSGLTGMGDLIATCISPQSRNRHVGEQLGRGRHIDEIIAEMNMVAEGVKTAAVVDELARKLDLDLPICTAVAQVCAGRATAEQTYRGLLGRDVGDELPR